MRLDRRADCASTGASPIGLAFRGQTEPGRGDEFWLYDALGPRISVHRDNERFQERPLVFVLEELIEQRRRRPSVSDAVSHRRPGELREVRVRGPFAPSVPTFVGPPVVYERGPHALELVVGNEGSARSSDGLTIRY